MLALQQETYGPLSREVAVALTDLGICFGDEGGLRMERLLLERAVAIEDGTAEELHRELEAALRVYDEAYAETAAPPVVAEKLLELGALPPPAREISVRLKAGGRSVGHS